MVGWVFLHQVTIRKVLTDMVMSNLGNPELRRWSQMNVGCIRMTKLTGTGRMYRCLLSTQGTGLASAESVPCSWSNDGNTGFSPCFPKYYAGVIQSKPEEMCLPNNTNARLLCIISVHHKRIHKGTPLSSQAEGSGHKKKSMSRKLPIRAKNCTGQHLQLLREDAEDSRKQWIP